MIHPLTPSNHKAKFFKNYFGIPCSFQLSFHELLTDCDNNIGFTKLPHIFCKPLYKILVQIMPFARSATTQFSNIPYNGRYCIPYIDIITV